MRARPLLLAALFAAALALAVAAAGCGSDRPTVTVFAAASLADALRPLEEPFERQTGVDVRFSFGGSTFLAQVIRRGAPVDVFIAAGPGPMDVLEAEGLVAPRTRFDLVGNSLVLAVPVELEDEIAHPEDLLRDNVSRFSMGDPALAPSGVYTREALERLGLWENLLPKRLLGANVRTALMYITSGTADAAIVYSSDALGVPDVRVVWRFPDDSHSPVRYPAAALAGADNPEGAASFLAFLRTEEAQAPFRAEGFRPAPDGASSSP
ncbi:MAG: molybdate ABC transporter substrate-binding protein [Chloroflexota bacterium]|nr:molybdate ABC transporter substrate-binding protein [Chloroflexota bacterium]